MTIGSQTIIVSKMKKYKKTVKIMVNALVLKANGKSLSHSPQSGLQLSHPCIDVYVCYVGSIRTRYYTF